MNRLPDIVVLDFCIWLSENVRGNNDNCKNSSLLIDALSREKLTSYAKQYLTDHHYDYRYKHKRFPVRALAEGFISSEEFRAIEDDPKYRRYFRDYPYVIFDMEEAFHLYLRRHVDLLSKEIWYDNISPYDLADNTLDCLSSSFDKGAKERPIMKLMVATQNEVSDEINFLEWILRRESNLSFESMPSEVFDTLIDEYAHSNGIEPKIIEKLKKEYYHIGWATVFKRIQRWFKLERKRPQKSLADVMERYLSKQAKYNCIILPLADNESQAQFKRLIKDEWLNLNDLSGDLLDIYYSESDIGKTGYDIAMRIQSLPDDLRKTAPSIILWKDTITEAKAIQTDCLSAVQIRKTIQTIVQQIEKGKDFNTIVQEAEKTVKKQEALNHGVTYFDISGEKNAVVTGNTGNTIVNPGDNSTHGAITLYHNEDKELLQEIKEAIYAINNSEEIDEDSKEQLVSIMKDAENAEIENCDKKRSDAKKAFGYVKAFLFKAAPALVSTLANLTRIATFFGLQS